MSATAPTGAAPACQAGSAPAAKSATPHVARVYLQRKARALDRPFDYRVPIRLADRVQAGSLVLVPLGRQKALGLVLELTGDSGLEASRLVDIEDVLDYPPIPPALIELALCISRYYYCSPASALALVLPPGGLPQLRREGTGKEARYSLQAPPVRKKTARLARLADAGMQPAAPEAGATIGDPGGNETKNKKRKLTPAQQAVIDVLREEGEIPLAALRARAATSDSPVKTLAARGIITIEEREVGRSSLRFYGSAGEAADAPLKLNPAQQAALDAIVSRLDAPAAQRRSRPLLLEGVPGAGKTEVYLQAIAAARERGGRAIVLVPEISLTMQAVRRLRRRFGDRVGVLHSGLSLGERYDEYMRIRAGKVDIVIGPRSALFAPLPGLRLIVVDEENDQSFKQESEPRYDARLAARHRAGIEGAALVYASATPSMECYHETSEHHPLPERATGAAMPRVEIVDMLQENDMIFSRSLNRALEQTMAAGQKAILLLNRRGFASYLQCGHCGHVWQCSNCEVSLTIHAASHQLACHHCGYSEPTPALCPDCASTDLHRWGIGSERLEAEVRARFPEAAVFRLDADTAAGYGAGPRILGEFSRTPASVLVGTQMVAKGHHFPEVTLSTVINADLALQFPEFRAEEQTFSILMQLAGRSGRAQLPGRVLIQTWNADIECIKMAAARETGEFYAGEIERRRRLEYPPFVHIVNLICLSRDSGKPAKASAYLRGKLAPVLTAEKVLGPADLFRLQGWSRSHILIKTVSVEKTLAAMAPVIERFRGPFSSRGVRIVVDVDPQWLS